MTYRGILRAALALPPEKRFRLFEELDVSLDYADGLSDEWRAEIARRSAELDQGKAEMLSGNGQAANEKTKGVRQEQALAMFDDVSVQRNS